MSGLTPELNLITPNGEDDTADYLDLSLEQNLNILDGLFSSATGHTHNGAHQGGALQFMDLTIGEDLTVNATLLVKQSATFQGVINAQGNLVVTGLATFNGGIAAPAYTHSAASVYDVPASINMVFVTVNGAGVRLPAAAASAQRSPITISANISITTTVTAVSGTVYGGSIDAATGAILNGTIASPATGMDAVTYKSDGTNWRAI